MADYYSPPEIVSVMGLVDTYLRWSNLNESPRGYEHYHPSAWGHCLRKMQYDRYAERGYIDKVDEKTEPFMLRIWGNGHSMHDRWRQYFENLGILRGYWQCTNTLCKSDGFESGRRVYGKDQLQGVFKPEKCECGCVKFDYHEIDVKSEELNFFGHCDAVIDFSRFDGSKYMSVEQSYMMEYLPQKPVVVDFKTINMFDFQDVAKGKPHDYYITQLTIYANILKCDFGILIYENKNNQRVCSFKVEQNEELFRRIGWQAQQMNEMVEVEDEDGEIRHLLPPPRCRNQEDQECVYCKYRERCHASGVWEDPELNEKRKEFYEVGTI